MVVGIAILAVILGLVVGIGGFVLCGDPEGRGANYVLLIPVGAVLVLGGLIALAGVGLRALFGGG